MQVQYSNFPIFNSNGSTAGVLDGLYDASPNGGQQPGWYALRKIDANGNVSADVVANIHIVGVTTA